MKSVFKLCTLTLLLAQQVTARDVIVISYKNKTESVEYLLREMKAQVTMKLIKVVEIDKPCEDVYKDVVLHICFDENDEMNVVRQNVEILTKTISKL